MTKFNCYLQKRIQAQLIRSAREVCFHVCDNKFYAFYKPQQFVSFDFCISESARLYRTTYINGAI